MAKFKWEPEYSVGDAEIDRQHQAIIEILNRLYPLLNGESPNRPAEVESVFDELAAYVSTHFIYEENLMLSVGYPPEKVAEHKQAHDTLLAKVQAIMAAHNEGDGTALAALLPFLYGNWLIEHICQTDKEYAPYLPAVQESSSAGDRA